MLLFFSNYVILCFLALDAKQGWLQNVEGACLINGSGFLLVSTGFQLAGRFANRTPMPGITDH
jgi:hypothetical protein